MRAKTSVAWMLITTTLLPSGCGKVNKILDPTELGRFRPTPAVNVILNSLGVAEETPVAWEDGEVPRWQDTVAPETDYTLGAGDALEISIYELFAEGAMVTKQYVVKETGMISIPDVGDILASGLTESQLEQKIKDKLSPEFIREPVVSVSLLNSQRRTCSVIGEGVAAPGLQVIPRNDYRLTDALAMAQGPRQVNVSYVYVARRRESERADAGPMPSGFMNPNESFDELQLKGPGSPSGSAAQDDISPTARLQRSREPVSAYRYRRMSQPFNEERQLIGMATPNMQRLWKESEKAFGPSIAQYRYNPQSRVIATAEFERLSGGQTNQGAADTPASQANGSTFNFNDTTDDMADAQSSAGQVEWRFENGRWVPIPISDSTSNPIPAQPTQSRQPRSNLMQPDQPGQTAEPGQIEWIFENGKWVPVPVGPRRTPQTQGREVPALPQKGVIPLDSPPSQTQRVEGSQPLRESDRTRLIKIPTDRLMAGDRRYDIVIRPGDTIYVPVDVAGQFYITGHVNGRGPVRLMGPTTLKQAIATAGGLDPLAYPQKCEVVRRIGENREEIVMVDLEKIARGEQPDFFIKPQDIINVGTHFSSRWRAVLRNAFRAAYGFGFVYDRNFADADFGTGWPRFL